MIYCDLSAINRPGAAKLEECNKDITKFCVRLPNTRAKMRGLNLRRLQERCTLSRTNKYCRIYEHGYFCKRCFDLANLGVSIFPKHSPPNDSVRKKFVLRCVFLTINSRIDIWLC